jgi:hypothetical protein
LPKEEIQNRFIPPKRPKFIKKKKNRGKLFRKSKFLKDVVDNDIIIPKKENDYSSSDDESKEDNFFECDKDSLYETNEKVIEKSPDGNYGKVYNIYNNIKK